MPAPQARVQVLIMSCLLSGLPTSDHVPRLFHSSGRGGAASNGGSLMRSGPLAEPSSTLLSKPGRSRRRAHRRGRGQSQGFEVAAAKRSVSPASAGVGDRRGVQTCDRRAPSPELTEAVSVWEPGPLVCCSLGVPPPLSRSGTAAPAASRR